MTAHGELRTRTCNCVRPGVGFGDKTCLSYRWGTFRSVDVGLPLPLVSVNWLFLWHRVFGWHFNTCSAEYVTVKKRSNPRKNNVQSVAPHPGPAASWGWPRLELAPPSGLWSGASPPSSDAPSAPFPSASSSPCAPALDAPRRTLRGVRGLCLGYDDITLTAMLVYLLLPLPLQLLQSPLSLLLLPPDSFLLLQNRHC